VRAITPDELPAFLRNMGYGFGWDPRPEPNPHFEALTEFERTRCAFDAGELVGTCGAYSLDLTVPGGRLRTGGTTQVTVRGTHRRRGLLRALLAAHLVDVQERGEALAALWASESAIYGRFGFGPAALRCSVEIERAHARFAEPLSATGSVRLVTPEAAREVLPPLYAAAIARRPGTFARTDAWWEHRVLLDPEWQRGGASMLRFAVYAQDREARGYALYRVHNPPSNDGLPHGVTRVIELQALDGVAEASLWRHLLDLDLMERLTAGNLPVDHPLPWLLADPRRARQQLLDSLWVRVVNVPGALEGRRYASADRLVLDVHDAFLPANRGTYALEGGPDGAKCTRTTEAADLRLDAAHLGALYLGGHRFRTLARAGRIEGDARALARADAMFVWDPLPWCPEVF
jgi:predicted acetyltransferase